MNSIKRYFKCYLIVAASLVVLTMTWSADVYVGGGTANDTNSGLSVALAKATLGAAIGVLNSQGPGDTLHVLSNLTENATMEVTVDGTAANPVTIMSDGGRFIISESVLFIKGQHIVVQYLDFDANLAHESSLVVFSSAASCLIDDNNFTGVQTQPSEHFNTEDTTFLEPDVAPVLILGASGVTIQDCVFTARVTELLWDFAIVMGSANGPAYDLTVTGCTVNANAIPGGVGVFRSSHNLAVTDCVFNDMGMEAVEISTANSTVASTTISGILIENIGVWGHKGGSSDRAAIRIYNSSAENVIIRNVSMSELGLAGEDGIRLQGAVVNNLMVDGLIFTKPSLSTSSWHVPVAIAANSTVHGVTIQNCSVVAGVGLQFENSNYYDVAILNCTIVNYTAPNGYGIAIQGGDTHGMYGLLIDGVYLDNPVSSYAIYATCDIDNIEIRNTFINGFGQYVIFLRDGVNPCNNFKMTNCTIIGNGTDVYSSGALNFYVNNKTMNNIILDNCQFLGSSYCCMRFRNFAIIENLTVKNCILDATTGTTTWAGAVGMRSDSSIQNATFENTLFTGNRGFSLEGAATKDNILIRDCTFESMESVIRPRANVNLTNTTFDNCRINCANGAIYGAYSALFAGLTFEDCYFTNTYGMRLDGSINVSDLLITGCTFENDRIGIYTGGAAVVTDATIENCGFMTNSPGTNDACFYLNGAGSAWDGLVANNNIFGTTFGKGVWVYSGARLANASFTNNQFIHTDLGVTDGYLREGGFLVDHTNTTFEDSVISNCSFSGGYNGITFQRREVFNGPGAMEPTVQNVVVEDCTITGYYSRGISVQYCYGDNLTFRNVAISDVTGVTSGFSTGAYLQYYGDNLTVENVDVEGNGLSGGMFLGTASGDLASNWSVSDCDLTNLGGDGLVVADALQDSTIENCVLSTSSPSNATRGVVIDNSAVTTGQPTASGLALLNCDVSGFGGNGIEVSGSNQLIQDCLADGVTGIGIYVADYIALVPATDIEVASNTCSDCGVAGIVLEGSTNTVAWNRILGCSSGIALRTGLSGAVLMQSNTIGNLVTRNYILGGVGSATGLYEEANAQYTTITSQPDPGPSSNVYLNNTVTDWGVGSSFFGLNSRIQNNIFAFNTGSGLRVEPSGLVGLLDSFNCSHGNGIDFDGVGEILGFDMHVDPQFVSRDPLSPNFYLLNDGASACVNAGTTDGTTHDGVTDLGCRESGVTEVASWRLF
jgi:Right handed beta helix region